MKLKKIFEVGIISTIRLNLYYFGLKSIFRPRILLSKHVYIKSLQGQVNIFDDKFGIVRFGFGSLGIIDNKYNRSIWENNKGGIIEFLGDANLGPGSKIANNGHLIFGKNFTISANSSIVCNNKIIIGNDCLFSWECLIMDTDFHSIYKIDSHLKINMDKPILIGNNVWVGCRSTLLKGTVLPDNSVIASCSRVSKQLVEVNTIYLHDTPVKKEIFWEQ